MPNTYCDDEYMEYVEARREFMDMHCVDDYEEEEEMSDREAYLAQFDQSDFI